MRGSRKFRKGGGVLFSSFLAINEFHRGPYVPPSRSNWTRGTDLPREAIGPEVRTSLEKQLDPRYGPPSRSNWTRGTDLPREAIGPEVRISLEKQLNLRYGPPSRSNWTRGTDLPREAIGPEVRTSLEKQLDPRYGSPSRSNWTRGTDLPREAIGPEVWTSLEKQLDPRYGSPSRSNWTSGPISSRGRYVPLEVRTRISKGNLKPLVMYQGRTPCPPPPFWIRPCIVCRCTPRKCTLGSFLCFSCLVTFFQNYFFQKESLRNTIRVSNGIDTDQDRRSVSRS